MTKHDGTKPEQLAYHATGETLQIVKVIDAAAPDLSGRGNALVLLPGVFTEELEFALNKLISMHHGTAQLYDAMYAYFSRDSVAMPGFAHFFQVLSVAERADGRTVMDQINKRGGRVVVPPVHAPPAEFESLNKVNALVAMEQALATGLHRMMHCTQLAELASGAKDPQVAHFLSGHGENEAEKVRLLGHYVTHLKKVGGGPKREMTGVYLLDRSISHENADLAEAAAIEAVAPTKLAMGSANRALKRSREAMEGALVGDCSKLHKALATGTK